MFLCKLILGLLTAQLAKWLGEQPAVGLIIGVFFGHFLDMIMSRKINEWKYKKIYLKQAKEKATSDFLFNFFTLAGKVCAADEVICNNELEKMKEIINNRFKLSRKDKKTAIKYFQNHHKSNTPVQILASNLVELSQGAPDMLKNTVILLKELAECDGHINKKEFNIIFTLSTVFGFDPETSETLIHNNSQNHKSNKNTNDNSNNKKVKRVSYLEKNLKILGCTSNDTNDKIKRNYRELVTKFHPDKIQSKDLPEDFIDFAKNRFTEIRSAYEEVKKIKGF